MKSETIRLFLLLSVLTLVLTCITIIPDNDSDAATYDGFNINAKVGDYVNQSFEIGVYAIDIRETSINFEEYGLSVSAVRGSGMSTVITIPGTATKAINSDFTIRLYNATTLNHYVNGHISIEENIVNVTGVSISGSSSGEVGDTITLTATSSPSSATDRGVTFSITSGSTRATITNQSETSTGGTCSIKLNSAGSITVTATATDGSGVKATKTITITEPEVLVTSVSISGSSTVTVGSSITLTATTSPSTADDRHVTWSITSGSTRVTYTTSDTTTGGRIVLTGVSAGTVTVRATAADGSGEYATKTITVQNPSNSFTLSYSGNGGSGVPSSQSGTSTSSTYSFTIPATMPSRSGYTFVEWNTSSSGSGTGYDPGDRITVSPGTTTLYAIWEQVTYTCHLNYSASGASNVPSNQSYTGTGTSNHVFTISSQEPVRSGYIFKGWSISNGGSAQYQPGDTISVGYNSTRTLYAVWESATLDITTSQGDITLTVGQGFNYAVGTNTSGCTVSVSGASWLSVSGSTVSGTPTSPGSYDVTITITKAGYTSDSQTFTVTVVSALGFTSVPTNGLVIVEV